MRQSTSIPRVSILGLGNVLLGDDAFGPLTIEIFRSQFETGPEIEIMDLGTPGLDLAPYLYGRDLVILVDAVKAGGEPGTVRIYRESDLSECVARLRVTDHDPGLLESIAHLRFLGRAPLDLAIVGIIPESCLFGAGISSKIAAAVAMAIDQIVRILMEHGVYCKERSHPLQATLWWNSNELPIRKLARVGIESTDRDFWHTVGTPTARKPQ
jgi:hydrogenase maturation protease